MSEKIPSIFSYTSYREYLSQCMLFLREKQGLSTRALSREAGITSPNYLQQVVDEKRNLTPPVAERLAAALRLDTVETDYLKAMLKFAHAKSSLAAENALGAMRKLVGKAERKVLVDTEDLRGVWTTPVLWELLKTKDFIQDPALIRERLRHMASIDEINKSLHYWNARGLVSKDLETGQPKAAPVDFQPSNDVRRIDIQRSHLHFIQLAQHRLNDALQDREFQGLTLAVKKEDFEKLRGLCREFIQKVNEQCAADEQADEVVRVQLCAYKLTKK